MKNLMDNIPARLPEELVQVLARGAQGRVERTPNTFSPPFHPRRIFARLLRRFGPQHWWPGETPLEVCVGAILTQNTAWTNVEKAIARLKAARALSICHLHAAPLAQLADWIRPAGYYNIKARRLRAFTTLVVRDYGGRLDRLLALEQEQLRRTLLAVNGIGPETADSMILYAAQKPAFVVDAYTRRFLARHGWCAPKATYDEIARIFTRRLPRDTTLYNEYHALIVALGKHLCRSRPRCEECPLREWPISKKTPG